MSEEPLPDPGWYPDPSDPAGQRYWDGQGWTEQTASATTGPTSAAASPSTSRSAIASLVLGLLWLYGVGSVLAIIFGRRARDQIDGSGGMVTGRGMATAGIVLGVIGVVLTIIVLIAVAAEAAALDPGRI